MKKLILILMILPLFVIGQRYTVTTENGYYYNRVEQSLNSVQITPAIQPQGDWTLAFRFYIPNESNGADYYAPIFSNLSSGGLGYKGWNVWLRDRWSPDSRYYQFSYGLSDSSAINSVAFDGYIRGEWITVIYRYSYNDSTITIQDSDDKSYSQSINNQLNYKYDQPFSQLFSYYYTTQSLEWHSGYIDWIAIYDSHLSDNLTNTMLHNQIFIPTPTLIDAWLFDEDDLSTSSTCHSFTGNHDGVYVNYDDTTNYKKKFVATSTNHYFNCGQESGQSYVRWDGTALEDNLDMGDSVISVSLWFRNNRKIANYLGQFLNTANAGFTGYGVSFEPIDATRLFIKGEIYGPVGGRQLRTSYYTTAEGYDPNDSTKWYHLVFVAGRTSTSLYLDYDVETNTGSITDPGTVVNQYGVVIGNYWPSYDSYYDVDDILIYRKELTLDEIKFLYNGGYGTRHNFIPNVKPIAYWDFENGFAEKLSGIEPNITISTPIIKSETLINTTEQP